MNQYQGEESFRQREEQTLWDWHVLDKFKEQQGGWCGWCRVRDGGKGKMGSQRQPLGNLVSHWRTLGFTLIEMALH